MFFPSCFLFCFFNLLNKKIFSALDALFYLNPPTPSRTHKFSNNSLSRDSVYRSIYRILNIEPRVCFVFLSAEKAPSQNRSTQIASFYFFNTISDPYTCFFPLFTSNISLLSFDIKFKQLWSVQQRFFFVKLTSKRCRS